MRNNKAKIAAGRVKVSPSAKYMKKKIARVPLLGGVNQDTNTGLERVRQSSRLVGYNILSKASLVYEPSSYGEARNFVMYPEVRNLFARSEEIDNATWGKNNSTVSVNVIANPIDSTVTADSLIETAVNGVHAIQQTITIPTNNYATISCYVKANTRNYVAFQFTGGTPYWGILSNPSVIFDTVAGTFSAGNNCTTTSTSLGNGWWRISMTSAIPVLTASTNSCLIMLSSSSTNAGLTYTGDGTSGLYVYGAQIELNSIMSTYQHTTDGIFDFQFTRATTATVVNKQGVIEDSCYNLLQQSEAIDNAAWIKTAGSVTANTIANPVNGQITADTFTPDTTNAQHSITASNYTFNAGDYITRSIYVKSNGYPTVVFEVNNFAGNGSTWVYVNFNLNTGQFVKVQANVISYGSTALPNGWYRIWFTVIQAAAGADTLRVKVSDDPNYQFEAPTFTGDGVSGIYVWGAQLEKYATLRPYFRTTNRQAVPRLDYSLDSTKPSLLIEPVKTNGLFYSNEFMTSWLKPYVNISQSGIIAPDNGKAMKMFEDTTNNLHYTQQPYRGTSTVGYFAGSVYAKAGERGYLTLSIYDSTNRLAAFDLITGVTGFTNSGVTSSITSIGNGWYRCTILYNSSVGAPTFQIFMSPAMYSGNLVYQGDGTSGLYLYGAQLETSTATGTSSSYIPTTTATVTRNVETSFVDLWNGNLLNKDNFTLYVEGYLISNDAGFYSFGLADTDTLIAGGNRIGFYDAMLGIYHNPSFNAPVSQTNLPKNSYYKCIVQRNGTTIKFFRNGSQLDVTSTTAVVDYRYLCVRGGSIFTVNKIELYKETLDDATCILKTT
jgi:hypothetical protein